MIHDRTYNIKFPYKSQNLTGVFDLTSNAQDQVESRLLMLLYLCGKIMDPDCGVCVGRMVFDPADDQFSLDLKNKIVEQTSVYLPENFCH